MNKAGGVAVYYRNNALFAHVLDTYSINQCDSLVVRFYSALDNISFTLCAVYRSPSNDVTAFIDSLSLQLELLNHVNFIFCGDINIDILTVSNNSQRYLDVLCDGGLTNIVSRVTRPASNTQLDHVFIRWYDEVQLLSDAMSFGRLTDHLGSWSY